MSAATAEAITLLAATDTDVLLKSAYSLTHKIHAARENARKAGMTGAEKKEIYDYLRDLRSQRDLITAEVKRRCKPPA